MIWTTVVIWAEKRYTSITIGHVTTSGKPTEGPIWCVGIWRINWTQFRNRTLKLDLRAAEGQLTVGRSRGRISPYNLRGNYTRRRRFIWRRYNFNRGVTGPTYWHGFSGRCDRNNENPMVSTSPHSCHILSDVYNFTLTSPYYTGAVKTECTVPYFLRDVIYPNWDIIMKQLHIPTSPAESQYPTRQEAVLKDVERCFEVIQTLFKVLWQERGLQYLGYILATVEAWEILHNRMVRLQLNGILPAE